MELKDLQEFMQKEENKAAFSELVRALGYEAPEDIEGLKKKNRELILKNQELKKSIDENNKILDSIDIEEYNTLKQSRTGQAGGDEVNQLRRELKKAQDKIEAESRRAGELESSYHSTLKDAAIQKALIDHKFSDQHHSLLKSAFQGKAKVEQDNGSFTVVIDNGDGIGLPVSDFFKSFAQSEQGKAYLQTSVNSGAGSRSFQGGSGPKSMPRSEFAKLSPLDQMNTIKEGTTITE